MVRLLRSWAAVPPASVRPQARPGTRCHVFVLRRTFHLCRRARRLRSRVPTLLPPGTAASHPAAWEGGCLKSPGAWDFCGASLLVRLCRHGALAAGRLPAGGACGRGSSGGAAPATPLQGGESSTGKTWPPPPASHGSRLCSCLPHSVFFQGVISENARRLSSVVGKRLPSSKADLSLEQGCPGVSPGRWGWGPAQLNMNRFLTALSPASWCSAWGGRCLLGGFPPSCGFVGRTGALRTKLRGAGHPGA